MPQQVHMGAMMACTFGAAPASLIVLPINKTMAEGTPAANIMDFKPIVNIPPFGVCSSLTFPPTATATAAALGVLTPMPCVPLTDPWIPGSPTVEIGKMPALNNTCKCMCDWGGVITITNAGTTKTDVA
jgi:hypothetical protein